MFSPRASPILGAAPARHSNIHQWAAATLAPRGRGVAIKRDDTFWEGFRIMESTYHQREISTGFPSHEIGIFLGPNSAALGSVRVRTPSSILASMSSRLILLEREKRR